MEVTAAAQGNFSKETVAVVTGANRGIGYEIVKQLLGHGMTVILTARDPVKGNIAAEALKAAGHDSVFFHPLEVSDSSSVKTFAEWIKKEFGGFDILVNNAGVLGPFNGDGVTFDLAKEVLDINYYGVKKVTAGLLPLLRDSPAGARIVIVSSRMGLLERISIESVKAVLGNEQITEEAVDSVAEKYLHDVKTGEWKQEGWTQISPIYCESKALVNAYARALAKSLSEGHQKISVNVMCPGVTETDMLALTLRNAESAGADVNAPDFFLAQYETKTVEAGADTGVWLCTLPKEGYPNGKFFGERSVVAY